MEQINKRKNQMASRLGIFQAYDYYHRAAAQSPLTILEKRFVSFCMEHHVEICDEETPDNDPIIVEASKLYTEAIEV